MYKQLLNLGLVKWYPSDATECGIWGTAVFGTFQQAFQVLVKQSSLQCRTIQHPWYTDWSWIGLDNLDETFFAAIDSKLSDKVILEIIKHIDPLHLVYFSFINERFHTLAESRHLRVFTSTVGTIGLMNLRYFLEKFGSTIMNLSLSLIPFRCSLGFCFSHTKYFILNMIYWFTGPLLKTVELYDFNLNESESEKIGSIFHLFDQRGIKLKFCTN